MDGRVPQNSDPVLLGDSRGFMLIPSFLHLNTKCFADLPVYLCICLVVAVYVYSFNQSRTNRDQMANVPIEMATQSAFWVHVSLQDLVLIPASWEALILGCDDKALGLCLEGRYF